MDSFGTILQNKYGKIIIIKEDLSKGNKIKGCKVAECEER